MLTFGLYAHLYTHTYILKTKQSKPRVVAPTFNPSKPISEFKASLVHKASSQTARATQRNLVSKKINTNVPKTCERVLCSCLL